MQKRGIDLLHVTQFYFDSYFAHTCYLGEDKNRTVLRFLRSDESTQQSKISLIAGAFNFLLFQDGFAMKFLPLHKIFKKLCALSSVDRYD